MQRLAPLQSCPAPRRCSGGPKMDLPTFFPPKVLFFPESIPEFEGSFARTDAQLQPLCEQQGFL